MHMTKPKKVIKRNNKTGKFRPLTVGDVEKSSGVKFNAPAELTLVEYFEKTSAKPLGDLLKEAQRHLLK